MKVRQFFCMSMWFIFVMMPNQWSFCVFLRLIFCDVDADNHSLFSFIWPKSIKSNSDNKMQEFIFVAPLHSQFPKCYSITTRKRTPLIFMVVCFSCFFLYAHSRQWGYEFSTILNSLSISFLSAPWILKCSAHIKMLKSRVLEYTQLAKVESTKSCINPWHGISAKYMGWIWKGMPSPSKKTYTLTERKRMSIRDRDIDEQRSQMK